MTDELATYTYNHDRPTKSEFIGMRPDTHIVEVQESYGTDFYVYAGEKLVRVCPSRGMADEVAAGYQG